MIFEEQTLEKEEIFKGRVVSLELHKVTTIDGESRREIVRHSGGAVIIAIDKTGSVPMVTQYRKAVEREVLEVPAGKLEQGEAGMETAIRELAEETGCRIGKVIHLTDMYPSVGFSDEVLHIYLGLDVKQGEPSFDKGEAIDISFHHIDSLVEMVMRQEITDGKSQVAILMAKEYLSQNRDSLKEYID